MSNNGMYDRHLNLFIFYGMSKYENFQDDVENLEYRERILENNVSRVLARLLIEKGNIYEKFQEKLLNKIGITGEINNVYFQKSNAKLREIFKDKKIKNIYGVTLTAFSNEQVRGTDLNEANCIPDIVLEVDDSLVFIEVKKTSEDAREQVMYQIKNFNNTIIKYEDVIKLYWYDITTILLNLPKKDLIIRDYIDYLQRYFPEWFYYKITDIIESDKESYEYYDRDDLTNPINVRMFNALKSYCNLDDKKEYRHLRSRRAIKMESLFTTECQLVFDKNSRCLETHFWTGETITDMIEFERFINKNRGSIAEFLKNSNKNVKCKIVPYILYRDSFKYIDSSSLKKENLIIPKNIINLLSGRRKFEKFEQIVLDNLSIIKEYISGIEEEIIKLKNTFYDNTNRTLISVSLGYEVIISYSYAFYSGLENKTDFANNVDGLKELVEYSLLTYEKYFGVTRKR